MNKYCLNIWSLLTQWKKLRCRASGEKPPAQWLLELAESKWVSSVWKSKGARVPGNWVVDRSLFLIPSLLVLLSPASAWGADDTETIKQKYRLETQCAWVAVATSCQLLLTSA